MEENKVKIYKDSLGRKWTVRDMRDGELKEWGKTHHITDWMDSHAVKVGVIEDGKEYWLSRFWKKDIEEICDCEMKKIKEENKEKLGVWAHELDDLRLDTHSDITYEEMVYAAGLSQLECTKKEFIKIKEDLGYCEKYGLDYEMFQYGEDSPEEYYEKRNEMPLHGIIDTIHHARDVGVIDTDGMERDIKMVRDMKLENIEGTVVELLQVLRILKLTIGGN